MKKTKSDNTLLIIAVIAVVVSAVGLVLAWNSVYTFQRIMLGPTDMGTVDVEIVQDLSIVLTTSSIDWGDGYVDSLSTFAELDSEGTRTGGSALNNWDVVTEGFVLENAGNVGVCIDISDVYNAVTFIGGTVVAPQYKFKVTNCNTADCSYTEKVDPEATEDTAPSCAGSWYTSDGEAYVDVSISDIRVCDTFDYIPTSDEFRIDAKVIIPSDAPLTSAQPHSGQDTMTVTATGLALC